MNKPYHIDPALNIDKKTPKHKRHRGGLKFYDAYAMTVANARKRGYPYKSNKARHKIKWCKAHGKYGLILPQKVHVEWSKLNEIELETAFNFSISDTLC